MPDLKISQFADGSTVQVTDEIATNRAGVNTKVFVGSAAAFDVGGSPGDVVSFEDDGGGLPQYPQGDGSQITNITLPEINAEDVIYMPDSGSEIISSNVQDAITELDLISQEKLDNITGLISSGTNISLSGAGTDIDPYVINSSNNELVITANTGSAYDMDFDNAQNFVLSMTDNCDLDIINPPSEGGSVFVRLIQDSTPRTATFNMAGLAWANGISPTVPAGNDDFIDLVFQTVDGGTNWTGYIAGTFE